MAADKQATAQQATPLAAGSEDNGMGWATEHAVIVEFKFASDVQRITQLEDELRAAIEAAKVGEFDGNELAVDGSEGRFYMYGPDADRLFNVVRPILEASPLMKGADVIKRYGAATGERAKETRVKLGKPKG
jgi:hypothetical protein